MTARRTQSRGVATAAAAIQAIPQPLWVSRGSNSCTAESEKVTTDQVVMITLYFHRCEQRVLPVMEILASLAAFSGGSSTRQKNV